MEYMDSNGKMQVRKVSADTSVEDNTKYRWNICYPFLTPFNENYSFIFLFFFKSRIIQMASNISVIDFFAKKLACNKFLLLFSIESYIFRNLIS